MNNKLKIFIQSLSHIDKKILKIMKSGLIYSFLFCILAALILLAYEFSSLPTLFYVGISIFKSGLFFIVAFTICGFAFNKIIHEL